MRRKFFRKKGKQGKTKIGKNIYCVWNFFKKKQGVESLSIYLGFKTLISKVFLLADLIFATQKFVK